MNGSIKNAPKGLVKEPGRIIFMCVFKNYFTQLKHNVDLRWFSIKPAILLTPVKITYF